MHLLHPLDEFAPELLQVEGRNVLVLVDGVDAPAERIAFESLHILGVVDVGEPDAVEGLGPNDLAVSVLSPIATEMKRLVGDKGEMDRILRDGADRARAIAVPIMDDVRKIVGFVR